MCFFAEPRHLLYQSYCQREGLGVNWIVRNAVVDILSTYRSRAIFYIFFTFRRPDNTLAHGLGCKCLVYVKHVFRLERQKTYNLSPGFIRVLQFV